jgi:hypothetical protein
MDVKLSQRTFRLILILSIIMLFIGCGGGGGGGGSSPTPEDATFKLFPDGYFTAGYQESYTLTGSDTSGGKFKASNSSQTGSSIVVDGEQVVPIMSHYELTETVTNVSVSGLQTSYYTDDPNNRLYLGYDDESLGISSTAISTTAIPQTAKVGDFGKVGTYKNTDGETEVMTWQLTDANNGLANLIFSTTYQDQDGNLASSEEDTSVIDQNGNTRSFTVRVYTADDGVTMTLSSN